jgi:hypothetical protein
MLAFSYVVLSMLIKFMMLVKINKEIILKDEAIKCGVSTKLKF